MNTFIETDFVGNDYPLTHGRICGLSVIPGGTVAASTEAAGFDAVNAADPRTFNFWKPTAVPATFTVTLSGAETLSYFAISDHDMNTAGASVRLEKSDGVGGWTAVSGDIAPANDDPFVFLCWSFQSDEFRFVFTGAVPIIGVIYAGAAIEVPVRAYAAIGTPVNLARKTEFDVNRATSGAYMGRSVRRSRKVADFPIEHVTESWVQNTLDPLIQDAILNPYFLAENPHQYPAAVQYKWTEKDIMPQRMGLKNLMQVTL